MEKCYVAIRSTIWRPRRIAPLMLRARLRVSQKQDRGLDQIQGHDLGRPTNRSYGSAISRVYCILDFTNSLDQQAF
jgi:hypothetical protein